MNALGMNGSRSGNIISSKRIKRCGKGREDSTGTRDGRQCGMERCSCLRTVACTVPMISAIDAQAVEQDNYIVVMQQLRLANLGIWKGRGSLSLL